MNIELKSIGDTELAKKTLSRAGGHIPGYRAFLKENGVPNSEDALNYPWTDKTNYIKKYPYAEILADDYAEAFTIFASSGSSGSSFYWPQLKTYQRDAVPRLRGYLEQSFQVHEKKTLAIVGLALGSWIGGEHLSWALKSMAFDSAYPFVVFSPGSHHDEIIGMICNSVAFVDQIILFVCPSAIAHLKLRAESTGIDLPYDKMRYITLGEPFPESVRSSLQKQAELERTSSVMYSVYGSADTGSLGAESRASVVLRQLLSGNGSLRDEILCDPSVPHFFHCVAPDAYLETVDRELCITRWQGIPLLRYNLHDDVRLMEWRGLREAVLRSKTLRPEEQDLVKVLSAMGDALPDVLAVAGRADSSLILCGTNISESMLDGAVKSVELEPYLTGVYRASVRYEGDRQYLTFDLEFKNEVSTDDENVDEVYGLLVQALGRVQPEFLDDWRNVYQLWDDDPGRRILQLNCVSWPLLSESGEREVKQRGIQS